MHETRVQSLCQEDPLEKELATHSSFLSWRIPWTEDPGGLQFMKSQTVGQFSSAAQSCLNLCDLMDCSMPGFPVHHQLPELAQTLVHRVGDAIQPTHPLLPPYHPAFNLSRHQGLFQ